MKCDSIRTTAPAYIWIGIVSLIASPFFLCNFVPTMFLVIRDLLLALCGFALLGLGIFCFSRVTQCTNGSLHDALYTGFGLPTDVQVQQVRDEFIRPDPQY